MISITTIIKQEGMSCTIGFSAKDQEGCSVLEGNIADVFKTTLSKTRELIFKAIPKVEGVEVVKTETLADAYSRTFDNPEDRDRQAAKLKSITEQEAEKLDPGVKQRADDVIKADPQIVSHIVQSSFLAGMQLAMRICRNRAKDAPVMSTTTASIEANNCASLIRICQVEIGAGRMARPKFTQEEFDEMDRIS